VIVIKRRKNYEYLRELGFKTMKEDETVRNFSVKCGRNEK